MPLTSTRTAASQDMAIATSRAVFRDGGVRAAEGIATCGLSVQCLLRTGAPVCLGEPDALEGLDRPFAQSRSSALLTIGVSLLPFWRTSNRVLLRPPWRLTADPLPPHLHRRYVERVSVGRRRDPSRAGRS